MKKNIAFILKAFFITFSLTRTLPSQIIQGENIDKIDFITSEIFNVIGVYNILHLLLFVFIYIGIKNLSKIIHRNNYILATAFSTFLIIGEAIRSHGSIDILYLTPSNTIISLIKFIGLIYLISPIIYLLYISLVKLNTGTFYLKNKEIITLVTDNIFLKIFGILVSFWGILLIIGYPGNLCWDVIGQIEQVILDKGFSSHHPLFHTLIIGNIINISHLLLGSYEVGLFIYMIFQMVFFAFALSSTIWFLNKRKVNPIIILGISILYIITPVYSNIATTAIKDVPFISSFILYMIVFLDYLSSKRLLKNHIIYLSILGVLTSLFRNNGLYMIALTYVIYIIISLFQKNKKLLIQLSMMLGILLMVTIGIQAIFVVALQAKKGSSREMLSLPFQQTARYLQLYQDEVTEEETQIINSVLGDVEKVRLSYDPDIADPVKNLYQDETVTTSDLFNYTKVWFGQFFKHPKVYFDAFFAHTYGWFDPGAVNSIRYEVDYDIIYSGGLISGTQKILLFIYRFLANITPIALLETPGLYTWLLFILTAYRKNKKQSIIPVIPLWIALLICVVSPCFYLHPRYAFPIMFTLPLLIGYTCNNELQVEE